MGTHVSARQGGAGRAPPHTPAGRLSPSLSLFSSLGFGGLCPFLCLQALPLNSLRGCQGKDKSQAPAPRSGVSGEWPLRGRHGYPPLLPEQRGGQPVPRPSGPPTSPRPSRRKRVSAPSRRAPPRSEPQSGLSSDRSCLHAALLSLTRAHTHTLGLASRPQHPLLTSAPGVPGLPGAPGFPGSPGGPWAGRGQEGEKRKRKRSKVEPHWMQCDLQTTLEGRNSSAKALMYSPGGLGDPSDRDHPRRQEGKQGSG